HGKMDLCWNKQRQNRQQQQRRERAAPYQMAQARAAPHHVRRLPCESQDDSRHDERFACEEQCVPCKELAHRPSFLAFSISRDSRSSSTRETSASLRVSSAVTARSTELSKNVFSSESMARLPICSRATSGS